MPKDIKKLSNITSKLPNFMESFMEQIKVFAKFLCEFFTASCPLFLELKAIIRSLMDYNPSARVLIKRKHRAAITWIINLQTKNFFHGETNQLAKFVVMNNNLCVRNPLICHIEVTISLHKEDSPPKEGQKCKFNRKGKHMEFRRSNKKAIPRWRYMTSSIITSPTESGK